MVEVQQIRQKVFGKSQIFKDKMKRIFDRKAKPNDFQQGDQVLKWDARYKEKGKHGKLNHLGKVPYQVAHDQGNNTYVLQEENGDLLAGGPANGHFLKHYLTQ